MPLVGRWQQPSWVQRSVSKMISHPAKGAVVLIVLYLAARGDVVRAACNVCQTNGVACVNATSYNMCFGAAEPNTAQLFTCNEGMVCTDLPIICFQANTQPASCSDTASCGICNANLVFACTSRTTFSFCFGALTPSNVHGTCPLGLYCDASKQEICVAPLTSGAITCGLEAPLTTANIEDNPN